MASGEKKKSPQLRNKIHSPEASCAPFCKGDERYILVEDCLTTFKELAREHRRHFDIPVVGITGTNGRVKGNLSLSQ